MALTGDEAPNGWDATSKEVAALRRELKLTWSAHEREHIQHEAAHGREHQFAQTAIDKAAALAQENKADANEWRETMNDRETRFSTKDDVTRILDRLDKIERAGLVATERESTRIATDTEEKRQAERQQGANQWRIGLIVGVSAMLGSVMLNLVIRLASP